MVVSSKKTDREKNDGKRRQLIRYKISIFVNDPEETALNSATYREYEKSKNLG